MCYVLGNALRGYSLYAFDILLPISNSAKHPRGCMPVCKMLEHTDLNQVRFYQIKRGELFTASQKLS